MLTNKKAVIFDMDGTLIDSMWMWKDIDIEYLGRFGIPLPDDLQQEIEGMGFSETANYFRERFQIPMSVDAIKADWNEMAYEKYAHHVFLKHGAGRFLKYLKQNGIKLGIATSNYRELAMTALKNNQIEDLFDCICTACEVAKGKPSPDIYLTVADRLGVSPEQCLVFEDVPKGIQAGLEAGMEVCAVEDAYSLDRRQEILNLAQYYIRDFDEIFSGTYLKCSDV